VSPQALDLRRSAVILWRHKLVIGTLIALGLIGNGAYALAQQEVYTSIALVVVGPSVNLSTQAVVVTSDPVLGDALRTGGLGGSVEALRPRVNAGDAAGQTLFISAQGSTAQSAEHTADAVARSYIRYVTSVKNPPPAALLQRASPAAAKPRVTRVLQAAGIGGLIAALVALIASLAIWRNDRRLRERDAIADSIGVPVLASLRASGPRTDSEWTKLLDGYAPGAADAWRLEQALRRLDPQRNRDEAGGTLVTVLSLSGDRDALALAPQLALFAASRGMATARVIGPQQDTEAVAALQKAATAGRERENLKIVVSDQADADQLRPQGNLSVIVGVVDGQAPRVGLTMRGDATLLAVTAGVATAEQLTRVYASAAADGRAIGGVLVANPISNDETTGRMPQITRPEQARMPTRMIGAATESRR
jgi:capsular polysaccharide biosynthesis protein